MPALSVSVLTWDQFASSGGLTLYLMSPKSGGRDLTILFFSYRLELMLRMLRFTCCVLLLVFVVYIIPLLTTALFL